jgi:hypothetical protein
MPVKNGPGLGLGTIEGTDDACPPVATARARARTANTTAAGHPYLATRIEDGS